MLILGRDNFWDCARARLVVMKAEGLSCLDGAR